MQQVPSQVSPDLATYIIANTGGSDSPYAWAPEQEGLPSHNSGPLAMADWASNSHVGTRVVGGLQAIGGVAEMAGGAVAIGACETGFGCAGAAYLLGTGWDNGMTGMTALRTGQATATWGERGFQALGMSPSTAALVYGATQLVPAGVEAYTLNMAVDAQIAANHLARTSYTSIGEFSAQGLRVTPEILQTSQAQAIYSQYVEAGVSADKAMLYTGSLLQTGKGLPEAINVGQDTQLIKLVPRNASGSDGISEYSPFFITRQQYNSLAGMTPAQVANYLGLPAEQAIRGSQFGFDVYSMTPKPGQAAAAFSSEVAPVQQGAYSASGGAQQILVPNRGAWTDPNLNKIGTIKGSQ